MTSFILSMPVQTTTYRRVDFFKKIRDIALVTHVDNLSFMQTFEYPSLDSISTSLANEGNLTSDQIETVLVGLKELPEYRG